MFFLKQPRIEEILVRTLAAEPNSSASDLLARVQKHRGEGSLPSVYQALRKLEKDGVVFRHKHSYSLALDWVLELSSFVDVLYDRYTQADVLGALPDEGERPKKWKFETISSAVPFWSHIVLCMVQSSNTRECHEYVDHVWFHLVSSSVEGRLIKAIQNMKITHYLFSGANTALDRAYEKEIEKGSMLLKFGARPLKAESYLSCAGPYVVRIKPSEAGTKRIAQFYRASSKEYPKAAAIAEFVREPIKLAISVEHNGKRADAVRKAFQPFTIGL